MHLRAKRSTVLITAIAALLLAHDADAGARRSRPLVTGQTTCWNSNGVVVACAGTGQDGQLQRGEPRSYLDNGDGTIRDRRTALTWEKMSNDGTLHDKDVVYTWAGAFSKIDSLNQAAFAGFTDWRLPNANELSTLIDRSTVFPAIGGIFNTACPSNCTVLTCSCTVAAEMIYWTSSSYVNDPDQAWLVNFFDGTAYNAPKGNSYHVRAVRGGS